MVKGKIRCESRHIDDKYLYSVFVDAFNVIVENKENFMDKWESQIGSEDILRRVIVKRYINVFRTAHQINKFDVDVYFKLVEKITIQYNTI